MQIPGVESFSLLSALMVGLLGSLHCVGMCGGIVGALSCAPSGSRGGLGRVTTLLAYNGGRISSYALAGALAGAVGALLSTGLDGLPGVALAGRVLASVFMVALGLYLAGWTHALAPLERFGARAWRLIEPWGRRLIPVRTPTQSFLIGLVWGWLPCGMVYSVLVLALASADPVRGALIMLAFGAGTLPMLLALGGAASWALPALRRPRLRIFAGTIIVVFGLLGLLMPWFVDQSQPHVRAITRDGERIHSTSDFQPRLPGAPAWRFALGHRNSTCGNSLNDRHQRVTGEPSGLDAEHQGRFADMGYKA